MATQLNQPGQTIPRPAAPGGGAQRPPWAQQQEPNYGQVAKSQAKRGTTNRLATTAQQPNDAEASLINYLGQFGLQSLAGWAWNTYVQFGGGQAAMDEITLELPKQKAFQDRFPAIAARAKAGLPQLTPAEYLQYESSLDAELAQVGAPASIRAGTHAFADIVNQGLSNDVSINEMQARIEGGYQAVRDADPTVRQYFADKFGVQGDHALATIFLAPDHSEAALLRMEREAEAGGAASRAGIDLPLDLANRIAALDPTGGLDSQFQKLAQLDPLFHQRLGDAVGLTSSQGVSAEFGLDATSAAAVQKALDERTASVAGGTSITSDNTGLTGVGTAR